MRGGPQASLRANGGRRSGNGDLLEDVFHHGVGREAVAGGVGAEPDAVPQDVLRQVLNVFRIHLVAASDEQGPDLCEAAPADDGAG